jgi:hypothetical protein
VVVAVVAIFVAEPLRWVLLVSGALLIALSACFVRVRDPAIG